MPNTRNVTQGKRNLRRLSLLLKIDGTGFVSHVFGMVDLTLVMTALAQKRFKTKIPLTSKTKKQKAQIQEAIWMMKKFLRSQALIKMIKSKNKTKMRNSSNPLRNIMF